VICVGTATIAAAIDAGGLGRYIFRGLRANDNIINPGRSRACCVDRHWRGPGLLGYFERGSASVEPCREAIEKTASGPERGRPWRFVHRRFFYVAAGRPHRRGIEGFYRAGDFGRNSRAGHRGRRLERRVERRFDLGGNLAHEALVAGEIDLYVEYTGTALLAILRDEPLAEPQEVYRRVKEEYADRFQLEWTEPLGFDNTFAILVRGDDAQKMALRTVSDAARVAGRWRAGFGQDFMSRADGYPGFARIYGLSVPGNSRDGFVAHLSRARREASRSDRRQLHRRFDQPLRALSIGRRSELFSALRRRALWRAGPPWKNIRLCAKF
jgi:osmoprotectant transport system permease protein